MLLMSACTSQDAGTVQLPIPLWQAETRNVGYESTGARILKCSDQKELSELGLNLTHPRHGRNRETPGGSQNYLRRSTKKRLFGVAPQSTRVVSKLEP